MLDSEVNAVINDIMACDAKSVFLICPAEYNRIDLLRELCNRHYKYFRFNPVTDDFNRLGVSIGERVLGENSVEADIVRGVGICNFGSAISAVTAVLKKIEKEHRAVLFVFDSMDKLPADYDYSTLVYLIKHAPSNLKIVLSSTKYLKLDFTRLEPDYPYIIEEDHLGLKTEYCTYEGYLTGLDDKQLAFLKYVAGFPFVAGALAEKISKDGETVLKYLVRKGVYAYQFTVCGEERYVLESGLREFLLGLDLPVPEYAERTYEDRYFEHVRERGAIGSDLTVALDLHRFNDAEGMIFDYAKRDGSVFEAYSYARAHAKEILSRDIPEGYPGLELMRVFACLVEDPDSIDIDLADALVTEYEGYSEELYYGTIFVMLIALGREKDEEKTARYVDILKEKIESGKIEKCKIMHKSAFEDSPIFKNLFTLPEADGYLHKDDAQKRVWYPKLAEIVAFQYVRVGNYQNATIIGDEEERALPGFVVPAKISAVRYFGADPARSIPAINQSVEYALEREDNSELSLLYSVLAMYEFYRGNGAEVEKYLQLAMSHTSDKRDDESRFFALMVRALLRSLGGETALAVRLSKSCLKYAEAHCPTYLVQATTAYAYALYKTGDRDKAHIYATEAIRASGGRRSCAWMLATGMLTAHLFSTGDLRNVDSLVRNMLKVVASHGLTMVVVNFADDIFEPLLQYARENNIEPSVVRTIDALSGNGKNAMTEAPVLKITMFGDISVSVNGEELQWRTRKSKELFLHYVLAGDIGMDRSTIMDFLWKGYVWESAVNNLKTTNNVIRTNLARHGIDYKLKYLNTRYILTINNVDNDYERYKKTLDDYHRVNDLRRKVELMDELLSIYRADFATDMPQSDFAHERTSLKQEMIINLLKLVRALTAEGEYTEAKRFLGALILIDRKNDYDDMAAELDRFIKIMG